jgi:hypothetical protein
MRARKAARDGVGETSAVASKKPRAEGSLDAGSSSMRLRKDKHSAQQLCACCRGGPRGHWHACQGAHRSAAPTGPAGPQDVAPKRPAASQHAFRVAARSVTCPLGRAQTCRRDHLSDLDGGKPLAAHGLRWPSRGQAGRGSSKGSRASLRGLTTRLAAPAGCRIGKYGNGGVPGSCAITQTTFYTSKLL